MISINWKNIFTESKFSHHQNISHVTSARTFCSKFSRPIKLVMVNFSDPASSRSDASEFVYFPILAPLSTDKGGWNSKVKLGKFFIDPDLCSFFLTNLDLACFIVLCLSSIAWMLFLNNRRLVIHYRPLQMQLQ